MKSDGHNRDLGSGDQRQPAPQTIARFCIGERQISVVALGPREQAGEVPAGSAELARFKLSDTLYALTGDVTAPVAAPAHTPADVLTGRELQVAALVARGLLNKQIADQLHISEWTVCAHLRRIYSKLQVTSRAAMVYRCAAAVGDHELS